MKDINIAKGLQGSQIVAGCMRIANFEDKQIDQFVNVALDNGIAYFDHADIYSQGKSESVFGGALARNKSLRDKMIIQTKCGIRIDQEFGNYFDFGHDHIISSVEGSLKRLGVDTIDVLLLHRPDTLMQPDQIAEAFDTLYKSGKVRLFGVSNQNPAQINLLNAYLGDNKLRINQLQLSIAFTPMIDAGLNVNMQNDLNINRDGGILEYSRLHDMTLQAWSPFQYGFFEGVFVGSDKYAELNKVLNELATKYNTTPSSIAVAWILRHPAKWQVVTGTTKVERLKEAANATTYVLTHQEWYRVYKAAGNQLP
ncbi:MAG: aldo/keto reductase [Clostridiales bacterium]|jgi:predicted oxidoreductase|nr:aldo/keto reductase [Clostridiales bacterium]